MRTIAVALAALCAALVARGGVAHAADQTILGRTLVVKNPDGQRAHLQDVLRVVSPARLSLALDAPAPGPATPREPRDNPPLDSEALLRGRRIVEIAHNGELYRLQATRLGKLILTK